MHGRGRQAGGCRKVPIPPAPGRPARTDYEYERKGTVETTHTGVATTLNALTPIYLLPLGACFLGERHVVQAWVATAVACAGIAAIPLTP